MSKGDVRVELNLPGVNEMMKSAAIQNALRAAGEAIARQTGASVDETRTINWIAVQDVRGRDPKQENALLTAASSIGLSFKK